MEKVIATNNKGYNQNRNFVELPHDYSFIHERDVFSTLLNQYFRLTKKVNPLFQFLHYRPGYSNVKLRHFFNTISFNNVPFIVTFETTLPRLGNSPKWIKNRAIKRLVSSNCKKIIALSQNAFDQQIIFLKENHLQYLDVIQSKLMVLHPSQGLLIEDYLEKNLPSDKIVFTIVGTDFFRKGGREVLNVFNKLIPIFPEIQLNIVSTLEFGDYASKTSAEDFELANKIIIRFPINIRHYKSLSNDKVLALFKETHIGLLPTWGDSYGYSVLEAQSAGCPVITTNLRALPEINNNDIGWLIEVPKLNSEDGKIGSSEERGIFQKCIENKLEEYLLKILKNPQLIELKGKKALINIKNKHNIANNALVLNNIYKEILD